jgi:hypothetical protein
LFSKIALEFDIDKVIPKGEQRKVQDQNDLLENSMRSFDLSLKDYENESNKDYSKNIT